MFILQNPTTQKKACTSFLLVGGDIAAILLMTSIGIWWHPSWHFIPKNWISCAGPLTLLCLIAKLAFRRVWIIFSPFTETSSAVLPHTMILSMYCRCWGNSPFSSAVWMSPWQMLGLCFHPRGNRFQVCWTPLQMKTNCDLHSAAKRIEKNALTMSIVASHLAALDSISYWSSNMSGTAALSGGFTSFRLW